MGDSIVNIDKDLYIELIKNINIECICLNELKLINVNRNMISLADGFNVKVNFEPDKYKLEKNVLYVYPKFNVTVELEDSQKAFEIKIEFLIQYTLDDLSKYGEEYIKIFLQKNVALNIWPYARELVGSVTTRMGLPALIIEPYTVKC